MMAWSRRNSGSSGETMVSALICGWWLDQARIANRQSDLNQLKAQMEAEREVLKAATAAFHAQEQAMLTQSIARPSRQPRPETKRPPSKFPASGLPAGMLILESEYHQKLIEGLPLQ